MMFPNFEKRKRNQEFILFEKRKKNLQQTLDPEECMFLSKMYSIAHRKRLLSMTAVEWLIFFIYYICLRHFAEIYCELYCDCGCEIYCGEVNKKFLQCYICLRYWKCSTIFLWNVLRKWGEHFLFFDPNIRKEQIH